MPLPLPPPFNASVGKSNVAVQVTASALSFRKGYFRVPSSILASFGLSPVAKRQTPFRLLPSCELHSRGAKNGATSAASTAQRPLISPPVMVEGSCTEIAQWATTTRAAAAAYARRGRRGGGNLGSQTKQGGGSDDCERGLNDWGGRDGGRRWEGNRQKKDHFFAMQLFTGLLKTNEYSFCVCFAFGETRTVVPSPTGVVRLGWELGASVISLPQGMSEERTAAEREREALAAAAAFFSPPPRPQECYCCCTVLAQ